MNTTEMPIGVSSYKDRRTALLVVGILEIVLGLGGWLLTALMLWGVTMAAQQGMRMVSMVPGLLTYAVGGAIFIVMGIGSIRLRRWARAL